MNNYRKPCSQRMLSVCILEFLGESADLNRLQNHGYHSNVTAKENVQTKDEWIIKPLPCWVQLDSPLYFHKQSHKSNTGPKFAFMDVLATVATLFFNHINFVLAQSSKHAQPIQWHMYITQMQYKKFSDG